MLLQSEIGEYQAITVTKKLIVCVTNFDHNHILYWPFVRGGGGILYQCQDSMPQFLLFPNILQIFVI